jgi:hypothetical protein
MMVWWPLGRHRREPAVAVASASPPMINSARGDGAWGDLPTVQRTLRDPLRAVAITNDFRNSLASHADPRFLAPLAHRVDLEVSGLAEGLVVPGAPHPHPAEPDLTVPQRTRRAVTTKAPSSGAESMSSGPTSADRPQVQRRTMSESPADLVTVPLELPVADLETLPVADLETPDVEPSSNSEMPALASRTTSSTDALHLQTASARNWGVSDAAAVDQGPGTVSPEKPTRQLSAVPQSPPQPHSTRADLPVVARSADPAADSAPLSVFAEAISTLTGPDDVSTDSEAPASRTPVQRQAAEPYVPGREPERPVVASAIAEHPRRHKIQPPPPETPTLGVRLEQAPLIMQRAPMTDRVSVPTEPTVQRVEFVTPRVAAAPAAVRPARAPSPAASSRPRTTIRTSAIPPSAAASPSPAAQRLSSQDVKQVPNPAAEHSLAVSRRETLIPEVAAEQAPTTERAAEQAPTVEQAAAERAAEQEPTADVAVEQPHPLEIVPETLVQRLTSQVQRPEPKPTVSTSATVSEQPMAIRSETPTPRVQTIMEYVQPPQVVPPARSTVSDPPQTPTVSTELPVGPAVTPERWSAISEVPTSGSTAPGIRDSRPAVSRLTADVPGYTRSSPGASRTLAVGPALTYVAVATRPPGPAPAVAMPLSSMFGSTQSSDTGSPAEDGFSSVQLQQADESAPPATEPGADMAASAASPTPSQTPTSGHPAPAAGAKPADLDELARRLYEPLSARLRAELWLDRERAGVMSDG